MNLANNPFYILEASPSDREQVIHEKAEKKYSERSEDVYLDAEELLLSPQEDLKRNYHGYQAYLIKKSEFL